MNINKRREEIRARLRRKYDALGRLDFLVQTAEEIFGYHTRINTLVNENEIIKNHMREQQEYITKLEKMFDDF